MGKISEALTYGLTIRESLDDGSDFTNAPADYRRLFLGEDGSLHLKDESGTVTAIGGGGAALVLLEQHTASNSASLDFTTCITSTYDNYQIEIVEILPVSASALWLVVSTDGGTNWDTTASHYTDAHLVWGSGGHANAGGVYSKIRVYPLDGRTMATNRPCSGSLKLYNPLGSTNQQLFIGQLAGGDAVTSDQTQTLSVTGTYNQVAAFNALRFIMSTGNIASGTIRVYGIAKA